MNKILFFCAILLSFAWSSFVQAGNLMTIDAKMNCLNIANVLTNVGYEIGGSPSEINGLTKGQYMVEVISSNANYGNGATDYRALEAVIWYGSRIKGSTIWYQTVQIGKPVVINYTPDFGIYGFIPDIKCADNTGATVLNVRKIAP